MRDKAGSRAGEAGRLEAHGCSSDRDRPGPQRGAACRARPRVDPQSTARGCARGSGRRRRLDRRHARDRRAHRRRGRPRPAARQPGAGHPPWAQHRPAGRARDLRRPHGRAHALSAGLHRARDRAPRARRRRVRVRASTRGRRRADRSRGGARAPEPARRRWRAVPPARHSRGGRGLRVLRRSGGATCSSRSAGGTRAGRSTRTRSSRRAFEREAAASSACRRWRRSTRRARVSRRSPASTAATAGTGPRPRAVIPRPCAARMSCRPGWSPPSRAPPCPSAAHDPSGSPSRSTRPRCWPRAGVWRRGSLGRGSRFVSRPRWRPCTCRGAPGSSRAAGASGFRGAPCFGSPRPPRGDVEPRPVASGPSELRVGYVVSRFPALSETFVVRELAEVDGRADVRCELFSLFPERPGPVHDSAAAWLPRRRRVVTGRRGVRGGVLGRAAAGPTGRAPGRGRPRLRLAAGAPRRARS